MGNPQNINTQTLFNCSIEKCLDVIGGEMVIFGSSGALLRKKKIWRIKK